MSVTTGVGRKAIMAFDELGQAPAPRRVFPQAADEPVQGFPYGSEWWMGYTVEDSNVTIHNVMLHYNRGAVFSQTPNFVFALAPGDSILGFKLSFTSGEFTPVTTTTESDFSQTGMEDEFFRFPVYKFKAIETSPTLTTVEMITDYVHGSNLGGL